MLAGAGAELVPKAEDADVIVANTCSFIASAQQESVYDIPGDGAPQDRWQGTEAHRRWLSSGAVSWRYPKEYSRSRCRRGHGRIGSNSFGGGPLDAVAFSQHADQHFDFAVGRRCARAAQGRFSRESWDGAIADLPNYLYDEATPECWRLRGTRRISRLLKAVIILAAFVLFPSCGANFVHGVSNR